MQISTTPDHFSQLEIDDLELVVPHEFLGLGHCLECDFAMNHSWATRDRVVVTALDVKTFLAPIAQPNAL